MPYKFQLTRRTSGRRVVIAYDAGYERTYGVERPITRSSIRRLDSLTYAPEFRAQTVSTSRTTDIFIRRNHFA